MNSKTTHCGYVAIVGRPNVGKSTLINALVGQKVSIVTPKPHTTRHRILGVMNRDGDQALFLDTPGATPRGKRVLHRVMTRAIQQAIDDADLTLLVVDAERLTAQDRRLAQSLVDNRANSILVLNKVDLVRPRSNLLPVLDAAAKELEFAAYVPVSARTGENLDELTREIFARLPEGPPLFPPGMNTDRDLNFRIAEIVREKLMGVVHQEVPYGLTVEVEHVGKTADGQWLVHALIWLERQSHKAIVIGKGGQILKEAGRAARLELNELLGGRVHLELWVKVREHWADSERELRRLGYDA